MGVKGKAISGSFFLVHAKSGEARLGYEVLIKFKGRAKMVRERDSYTVELRTQAAALKLVKRIQGKVASIATIDEVPRCPEAWAARNGVPLFRFVVPAVQPVKTWGASKRWPWRDPDEKDGGDSDGNEQ